MTFLSVKALRYYHDVGLLEPSEVDSGTGYRSYELSQVATAQVIRRFRDLRMTIDQIKAILAAPGVEARNGLIVDHLQHMEAELVRTQGIVASLHTLLDAPAAPIAVEYRSVPALRVAAITDVVEWKNMSPWFYDSFDRIGRALRARGVTAAGPQGGLFPTEIFTEEVAEMTLFVPIAESMPASGNIAVRELPATELAVAVHRGPYSELDRTFGLLGAHVLERTIAVAGPIREHYLVTRDDAGDESGLVTEIGWPIFRTKPGE